MCFGLTTANGVSAAALTSSPSAWRRWSATVQARPWPLTIVSLAVMIALLAPVFALRLDESDAGNDPANVSSRHAYDLLAQGFGQGFSGPLLLVTEPSGRDHTAALAALRAAASATPDVVAVTQPQIAPSGTVAVMKVYPGSAPQALATTNLVNRLRNDVLLGVTVAVFQWGWLGGLLGVQKGPIEAWVPVIMFAVVFGLSMDYEVFLVSRIREQWLRKEDASAAVAEGVSLTGRVITAAAAIMVCVFLSFVLGDERTLKEFGFVLAVAVFLDALVVRCMLLPASLELLGPITWRLPHWLDTRLPHINIEGSTARTVHDPGPAERLAGATTVR